MPDSPRKPGSPLLLDEYFASGDARFLAELMAIADGNVLARFVERWKIDPRPWARRMQLAYLDAPWTTPGHNVVVKRLYKQAERNADQELLAGFLHRFDILVRREETTSFRFDSDANEIVEATALRVPSNPLRGTPPPKAAPGRPLPIRYRNEGTLFSARTRYYLRRRVHRLLRQLAHRDPAGFVAAAAAALGRYRDIDLATGADILDSWCLLQLCYRQHEALRFGPDHVAIVEGHTLAELTPAPRQLHAWRSAAGAQALFQLVGSGKARAVRVWAMGMLRQHGKDLLATNAQRLRPLFDHDDDEVQVFAAELLQNPAIRGEVSVADWLALLRVRSGIAQIRIAEMAEEPLQRGALPLAERLALAQLPGAPVAALGLRLLRADATLPTNPDPLTALANAQCAAVAGDLAQFALSLLAPDPHYRLDAVSPFFDAPLPTMRRAAWDWLDDSERAADLALWARLIETPYADARDRLLQGLQRQQRAAALGPDDLTPLWTSVLLSVHRGGRSKIQALHQLAAALANAPERAASLLPVVAVAVRSVRPAEARIGLGALIQAVERAPQLRPAVLAAFPELRFVSEGSTA